MSHQFCRGERKIKRKSKGEEKIIKIETKNKIQNKPKSISQKIEIQFSIFDNLLPNTRCNKST